MSITRLDIAIRAAGIPIHGVAATDPVRVDFTDDATEEQRTAAQGIVDGFNWEAPGPITVSPRQIRQALTAVGYRAAVEAAVANSDQNTKDWWEFATAFESDHPVLGAMAAVLGLTAEQVRAVFELAVTL